jgi:tetratricopeptide (TPR) repeat protein
MAGGEDVMVETAPQQALLHAVFLRRLADAGAGPPQARLGHGAFLTLRLVDLLDPAEPRVRPDVFGYQLAAMDRVCRELPGDETETAHLVGLVQATADAFRTRDAQLIVPALLAYAHYLEDELLLHEALDVLETVLRVGGDALRSADRIGARLRAARVLRKLNEFDAAEEAYEDARTLAAAGGDRHSELLSRIGRANAVMSRGNLQEATLSLEGTLRDAEACGDREAQARAHQVLAVVLSVRGEPSEAIPHEWRAFELYGDEPSRMRVLSDLGIMLLRVGDVRGAECALAQVVRHGASQDVVDNAAIELMNCASYRRDRVGFERWREQCVARQAKMPPNILMDFLLKDGIGRARFGQFERAHALLASALSLAEDAGLHEFAFRVERMKNGLRDCQQGCEVSPAAATEPVWDSEAVREVSAALSHLAL